MIEDVAGKTAFITGGASGMGLGMALAFAGAGMKVIIADIRQPAIDAAMAELEGAGPGVHAMRLDVTDRAAWAAAAGEAEAMFGKIHLLALNAGVGVVGPMQAATFQDWDFNLGVNLGGVVNGLVTLLPRMLAHGEPGHVVATSSTGGFSAVGGAGLYCTSKFALAGMMESLATDLKGTAIGASVFFPGPVDTALAVNTHDVRPADLRNADPPPPAPGERDTRPAPGFDSSLFMTKEEVGERVLRGVRRGDLFIMTHPEFRDGLIARNAALLRAIPDEPINTARAELVSKFGTLMYNPIYETQREVPGEPFAPATGESNRGDRNADAV